MHEEGRPCGRPSRHSMEDALRGELADERRPVAERRPRPWAAARAGTRAEQVVTAAAHEERAAPRRVVARVADVLTRQPDRVAVHCGGAVVAPPRARRVAADLLPVAREAVVHRGTLTARNDVP